jgi:general secretion pathway protein A
MGKTMVCRAVMDQLDRRTLTSYVADPAVSIEEVLKTTLIDFGVITRADAAGGHLARASRRDLSTALHEFLTSLAPLEAFAVVVIDEAHKLTIEDLEEIRTLYEASGHGDHRLLQFVLVGQPRLLSLLHKPQVRKFAEQASVRCVLEPLAEDEIFGYILHRMAVAGSNARIDFDDTAVDRLFVLSGGVPRVINLVCDRALELGHETSATTIDAALIDRSADQLAIAAPDTQIIRVAKSALIVSVLVLLMLVGAGAGAFVFQDRLARVLVRWEATPAPPRAPVLRQTAPFRAQPQPPLPGEHVGGAQTPPR